MLWAIMNRNKVGRVQGHLFEETKDTRENCQLILTLRNSSKNVTH